MLHLHKNFFIFFLSILTSISLRSETNPHYFIDSNAQKMVELLTNHSDLFSSNREAYENKIKEIFEPMIDFRRVSASVMGKKYYLIATKEERSKFELVFKDSLLDTYAETLAQWGNSTITTEFPDNIAKNGNLKNIEVKQTLDTGSSKYPISYKLRLVKKKMEDC